MQDFLFVLIMMVLLGWLQFGRGQICPVPHHENVTSKTILQDYHQLKRTKSGDCHAARYHALQYTVLENQDALYDLIFSGILEESELHELMFFGGHGGSVGYEHNTRWHGFIARVRERQTELPESVQSHLGWLLRVHNW